MTARERFLRVLEFKPVDRVPVIEWAPWWDKTLHRWQGEGLALKTRPDLLDSETLRLEMGLDLLMQEWIPFMTADTPMPGYVGGPIIADEAEYMAILPTLYPKTQPDFNRLRNMAQYQASGQAVTWLVLEGFFWAPRSLLGIEPHLYAFYDCPELLHRICTDLLAYFTEVLERVFDVFVPDCVVISEDMSYNHGPMISEALFDAFLLPYYRKLIPIFKAHNMKVFIDSDGNVNNMIPWFQRAGFDGVLPMERQAGTDVVRLRRQYADFLFIGNFDKTVMKHGEAAMRKEFERLLPVLKQGGFIPSVDHQTPPDVSLENYYIFRSLLTEYAHRAVNLKQDENPEHLAG